MKENAREKNTRLLPEAFPISMTESLQSLVSGIYAILQIQITKLNKAENYYKWINGEKPKRKSKSQKGQESSKGEGKFTGSANFRRPAKFHSPCEISQAAKFSQPLQNWQGCYWSFLLLPFFCTEALNYN